ncbi:hypothetical protein AAG570_013318 [Ranatra chinensis]|uniref:Tetratricopeptide repeat protein 39B n=1 Tax=Ranatra chinensis TaxID=642074 RepID=A0ABD0YGF4_9HEMI
MYHTIGNAVFSFLEAVLTFDQQSIEKASEALKTSINLCDECRRKCSLSESIGKIVRKPSYDNLTAEEMHAELCYAESLLLKSMLTFIEDETLVSFIKAGLKIRTCFNSYKECSNILKSRNWSNESHKIHFESGVRVGIGAFNLMISQLPSRAIKLLEFIGFSGSKEIGLRELNACYRLHEGIRQVLSVMTLLTYNLIVVYILSHTDGDLDMCDEILQCQLKLYPEGAWFLYFKGRLEFMRGNINDANNWYVKSWKSQSVWPQFHHLCFWELMWTNCVKQDWEEAAMHASSLLSESRWSRTIYGYQKVSMMLMMKSLTKEQKEEISLLIKNIPGWRQKIAGKSLPMEKFCAKRCERYIVQGQFLVLPAIELLYVWNFFKVLGKTWHYCHAVYKLILNTIMEMEGEKWPNSEFNQDNKALLLLLKGACLNQMGSPLQAEECFKEVLSLEKKIKEDHFLPPFAMVELAITYYKEGSALKAIQLLEDVKKNYTGYSLESRLHFRIHSALIDFAKK